MIEMNESDVSFHIISQMIYQTEVTFHSLEGVKFIRNQDASRFKVSKGYKLQVSVDRRVVTLMEDEQNTIGWIHSEKFFAKEQKTFENKLGLFLEKDKTKQESITFKGSDLCLKAIYDSMFKNKKYKSCLAFVPSKVQHISILSGESATQKYRGFMNLIGIMFLVLNLRNIIDNFYHYGVQFKATPNEFIPYHTFLAIAFLFVFIVFAFLIEKMKFNNALSPLMAKILLTANWISVLMINLIYCHEYIPAPAPALIFTVLATILTLKLISFQQINSELFRVVQKLQKNKKKGEGKNIEKDLFTEYEISSDNLQLIKKHEGHWESIVSFNKLVYFIYAPTLCYQLEYPKTSSIRKGWLVKRLIQLFFVIGLMIILWLQYIEPYLKALFKAMNDPESTWLELLNRHLQLSVPNTITWIAGFYATFHLWFNILGEVMYFGDRNFYKDWWNCRSIEEYWKTWNLPVHFWFIRHVYNPLLKKGFSKMSSNLIVFFISAVAHEYLVSVPLGILSYYAFLGMLMQAPAMFIQKKMDKILGLEDSELGNASFWIFFCFVGQPFIMTVYYEMYIRLHPEMLD